MKLPSAPIGLLLLFSFCLYGCDSSNRGMDGSESGASGANTVTSTFHGDYPIKVTVTVGMVADLVREIGGERVQVTQLMGAGVDPHLYTPTRDDAAAILGADIVFYNGLMLEGKMAEILSKTAKQRPSLAVAEAIPPDRLGNDPELHGHPDPHVWMDVSLWQIVAAKIAQDLVDFDPGNADFYRANHQRVAENLERLHRYGKSVIGGIPKDQRVLITSHDAFRYFGAAYDIEVQAVQGISTESEAGLKRINELVDMLVHRKIASVFIESSVPKQSIESLLEGAKRQQHNVRIGGSLFSDAMGEVGKYEGTYVGMMDHNLTTIARALGSQTVPVDGFAGYAEEATTTAQTNTQDQLQSAETNP